MPTLLLLLGVAVAVPIALHLALSPGSRTLAIAIWVQPPAAALVATSFTTTSGTLAAVLTLPWGVVAIGSSVAALARLRRRGIAVPAELCIDAGLLYFTVGFFWLFLDRSGLSTAFSSDLLLLTAVHFHFAGLAAGVASGSAGRYLAQHRLGSARAFRWVALAVVIGPGLVGLGIAFSRPLETAASIGLAVGLVGLALITLRHIAPTTLGVARALLTLSSLSSIVAMTLATIYAVGRESGQPWIGTGTMVATHGVLNGIGFALLGLAAWAILDPTPSPKMTSFSRLRSGWHVGPSFLAVATSSTGIAQQPVGIVDDLAGYDGDGFLADEVQPDVREFYERTASFDLEVTAVYARGFRTLAGVYHAISSRIEQMNVPGPSGDSEPVESAIVPVSQSRDGRPGVRGWIRTYQRNGRALYVAAYAASRIEDRTFMNIAFPLPGGNLTSVLAIANHPLHSGGVVLTTRPDARRGPQGVYFANPLLPVRLPINETIAVWPSDRGSPPGPQAIAHHDIWIIGLPALTLRYKITRHSASD
ncbi:MAG TPA: YndJ family protein [Candidatus Dormibacteraeota bacterium]